MPGGLEVGDMVVVGPTGRRVRLPSFAGLTYPDHAIAMPRAAFDDTLRNEAIAAGAEPVVGHAVDAIEGAHGIDGFVLGNGLQLRADTTIGADGATSRVAEVAGLVDRRRAMWGFAIRGYLEQPVDAPHIVLWEPSPWRSLPGYGWLFPGPDGQANVGLGIGTLTDRTAAASAVQLLPAFLRDLETLGLRTPSTATVAAPLAGRLGGWLKMGMVGTVPAAGRVMLVGDAAGLVNPLQGEGISQAMTSGLAAAESILADPAAAATRYLARLATDHIPYHQIAAATQAALLPHPRFISAVGRTLTLPGLGQALRGGWSIFWNELCDGASPSRARAVATLATSVGRTVTGRTATRRWFDEHLDPGARARRTSAAKPEYGARRAARHYPS